MTPNAMKKSPIVTQVIVTTHHGIESRAFVSIKKKILSSLLEASEALARPAVLDFIASRR